ncbi:histidine triad nucleotide-binding protein [Candidatus Sumerlaeota bacterium]|nr:histidine triad nucleotide-binding protein [Candidatus Sumerlaeota bacterium]
MSENCIFCKIAAKQIPSRPAFENAGYYAFHDINPAAPVHVLVIPKKHIATTNDLETGDEALIGGMFTVAKNLAAELGIAEPGYRMVFNCNKDAGQTVCHIHLHLLGGRQMKWPPG